jgi:two-component system LytT family response regulator
VVDDSRLARAGLIGMLARFPAIEVVGEADHPDTALPLVESLRPDVLFLDIQMAGANAFDLLSRLDDCPRIVFTTAYSEYAVRSFDYDTVDYLLKPISQERLAQAVERLLRQPVGTPEGEAGSAAPAPARPSLDERSKIFIKDGARCHLVALSSIRCIESCKNYVQVYFDDTHAYVKKPLAEVAERLPAHLFFRASRQHVVNLNFIASFEEAASGGYLVVLDNGKKLEISRRSAAMLKETMSL